MLVMRIARRLHAPYAVVVYEDGIVEDELTPTLPTSPSDLTAAVGSPACAGSLEALYMWLGGGRVDMAVLDAPIVDRRGNVNTHRRRRLRRATGASCRIRRRDGAREPGPQPLAGQRERPSAKLSRKPSITSPAPGYLRDRGDRAKLGYLAGTGPTWLLNPLGLFGFPEEEVAVAALHPGVEREDVHAAFGWSIDVPREPARLPSPTPEELSVTRAVLSEARARAYRLPEAA